MKTDIHPEYVTAHVRCTCGNEFETRSTKPEIKVEICSNCHANKALMKKYGLSTAVSQTYVADFHGMTASLQGGGTPRESSRSD